MHTYSVDSNDFFVIVGNAALNTTFWKLMAPYIGYDSGDPANPSAGQMFGRDYLTCPVKPRPSPDGSIQPAG